LGLREGKCKTTDISGILHKKKEMKLHKQKGLELNDKNEIGQML